MVFHLQRTGLHHCPRNIITCTSKQLFMRDYKIYRTHILVFSNQEWDLNVRKCTSTSSCSNLCL
uniref:Uncharacterized protein n=1 Tax=Cannabis sativa TaxID=3483 RepID=A0A803QY11_CANSA